MLKETDEEMAERSLREELTAISAYKSRIERAGSPGLRKAFRHALGEEKTHAHLFRQALNK